MIPDTVCPSFYPVWSAGRALQKTISTEEIPIKLWLRDMEEDALQQARNLANLPFAFHHVAIMPDAHFGYGMPIGGVLATDAVIIPNAVGVDIGCGMCAVKTSLRTIEEQQIRRLLKQLRATIPLGFKHHARPQHHSLMPEAKGALPVIEREFKNAATQIGTLGGGNHFIEIQRGQDGLIWFMVHSGSRNLGYQVANYYNKRAINLNRQWKSSVPPSWQLAYLPMESEDGQSYFREMNYCVDFARANRMVMCKRIEEAFLENVAADLAFEQPVN
ncbi:MAG: RtcB family protein, partial [Desulfofustis sp.]|nr:RtcB family protein [Desulfofustis sp.]